MSSILVLGGAGYIGSHTVYELIAAGENVVVVDNLETGFRKAIHQDAKFYQGDIRDKAFIDSVFEKEEIDGVIHFAANSQVGEMENRNVFLYLKQTAQFQQTVMAKQSFPWRRCLNGQPMPMIYVLYPYVISMPVEHIQMEK